MIDDKTPRFVSVSEVLKHSVDNTKHLLQRELEIRRGELLESLHFASLERIFIENKLYEVLEGKKSVTKAELQEFIAGSQLRIEEEMSGYNKEVYDELDALWKQHMGVSLSETFSDDFDLPLTVDNMADVFDDAERDGYDVPTYEMQHHMLNLARNAGNEGRWSKYKLGGGKNYRELVFKILIILLSARRLHNLLCIPISLTLNRYAFSGPESCRRETPYLG